MWVIMKGDKGGLIFQQAWKRMNLLTRYQNLVVLCLDSMTSSVCIRDPVESRKHTHCSSDMVLEDVTE